MAETSTAAIEHFPAFIAAIREVLSTKTGTAILAITVLVFLLFKVFHSPLFQAYIGREAARAKTLEDYLASTHQDPPTKIVVADLRNALVFQAATGIYAEEKWRKGLVKLHDKAGVNWTLMRRAWTHMDIKTDGTVFIKDFGFWDYAELGMNIIMTVLLLGFGAFSIIVALKYATDPSVLIALIFTGFLFFGGVFWFLSQTLPMVAARNIRRVISP